MSKEKVIWFTKGHTRKEQIYDWFKRVTAVNNLQFFINQSIELWTRGKTRESFKRFANLVDYLISYPQIRESGDTLAYLIEENISLFGRTRILIDLYEGVIEPRLPKTIEKTETPKVIKGSDLKEVEKEVKKEAHIVYGINKEGNKERAIHKVYIARDGKPVHYLQSLETGRRLTHTEAFKESIKNADKKNR